MAASRPVLSVRGSASRIVPPDAVALHCALTARGQTRAAALRAAAEVLDRLTGDLAGLGAVRLSAETVRADLTWSAQSTITHEEQEPDTRGRWRPTGQVVASVSLLLSCRDFDRLEVVSARLAAHDGVDVGGTTWSVDADNPAWREVRAEAVGAAVSAAEDLATALGGTVETVDHVADTGLLSSEETGMRGLRAMAVSSGGGGGETPSLDPVPQEVAVTVEARFTAGGVTL